MLFIPVHRRITLRHFPALTLALVAVNVLVFSGLQEDQAQQKEILAQQYLNSGLADIEYPRFLTFHGDDLDETQALLVALAEGQPSIKMILVESDAAFLNELRQHRIVMPNEPIFDQWKDLRGHFDGLREQSFTYRFLLSYSQPRWYQWLTHMFLHGGFGHLLGNMIFLVLLGLLVEPALKGGAFVLCYLVCGLVAASASMLLRQDGLQGLLGASGAIAGLMGLYTVLFGFRRVKFFYWIIVYFDYVKAPALLLLPLWLGWELSQYLLLDSNVAYEAHVAGIVGGATLALLLLRTGRVDREYLDLEQVQAQRSQYLAEAETHLRALRFEQAKRSLRSAMETVPEDLIAREMHFKVCRYHPEDEEFHQAARWLLSLPEQDAATADLVLTTYRSYRQATAGRMRQPPQILIPLIRRLTAADSPEEALELFKVLVQRLPQTPELAQLREAIINAFKRTGRSQPEMSVPSIPANPT